MTIYRDTSRIRHMPCHGAKQARLSRAVGPLDQMAANRKDMAEPVEDDLATEGDTESVDPK